MLLFIVVLGVFLANGRVVSSNDNIPARYLPFNILRHGSFYLDGMPGFQAGYQYYARRVGGRIVSDYPVGTALLAVPIYAPFVVAGLSPSSALVPWIEKTAAGILVAASVAILYLALCRLTTAGAALALACVYGLGTSALSISSQGLWQHAGSQLALAAALYCALRGRQESIWSAAAGLPLAFAIICRPSTALLVAPIAVYVLTTRGEWRFVLWALPPLAFQMWYGATYFGNPLRTQFPISGGQFSTDLGAGLHGVLLSPGRGLIAYSPIFLLAIVGAVLAWRPGGDGLLRAVSIGIVPTVIVCARWIAWHGGLSYGPRLLADLTPLLTVLLVPVVSVVQRSRAALTLAVFLALWSVTAHASGLVPEWTVYYRMDLFNEALWEWKYHPVVRWLLPARDTVRSPDPFFNDLAQWGQVDGRLRLTLNGTTFVHGDTARLGIDAENNADTALDVYVGIYVPEHRVALFLPAPDRLTPAVPLERPEWFRRFRTLGPRTRLSERQLLTFTFDHHFGASTLYYFAALVEPGSHPWRVIAASVERFEVRPVKVSP